MLLSCRAGLFAILLHVQENPNFAALASMGLAAAKIRVTAHFNDE
jgi:hypothetical protein